MVRVGARGLAIIFGQWKSSQRQKNMDVCLRVSSLGCIPDPELLTAEVNLPELELETLNIRQRTGCVDYTDGLLASKCGLIKLSMI